MRDRLANLWEYQAGPLLRVGRLWVRMESHRYTRTRWAWGVQYQDYPGKWYVLVHLGWWYVEAEIWKLKPW